jgi:hypothetical protein
MRSLLLTLPFLLGVTSALAQSQSPSEPWDVLDQKGAHYAGTIDAMKNIVEFVCPVSAPPQLIVISPQFRVSMPDGHRYTLRFVTDKGRTELVATAKDAELIVSADDLNAQITLQRLMDDIAASGSFTVATANFGWQARFTGENAAIALKGVRDACF